MQNDYGATVSAPDYLAAIAEHPFIAESDAGIIRLITEYANVNGAAASLFKVLEIGPGPGRITKDVGIALKYSRRRSGYSLVAVEQSESFARFARNSDSLNYAEYIEADFIECPLPAGEFDVVYMQGVMHHVAGPERAAWFEKMATLLKKGGHLIIGDEFIPDYEKNDALRRLRAAGWYAYVIASAIRCGNAELADEEVRNLIDDVGSGTAAAGRCTNRLTKQIIKVSMALYDQYCRSGARSAAANEIAHLLVDSIDTFAATKTRWRPSKLDRGDFKISPKVLHSEAKQYGFKLETVLRYGPVEQIGGMAVMSFTHK